MRGKALRNIEKKCPCCLGPIWRDKISINELQLHGKNIKVREGNVTLPVSVKTEGFLLKIISVNIYLLLDRKQEALGTFLVKYVYFK